MPDGAGRFLPRAHSAVSLGGARLLRKLLGATPRRREKTATRNAARFSGGRVVVGVDHFNLANRCAPGVRSGWSCSYLVNAGRSSEVGRPDPHLACILRPRVFNSPREPDSQPRINFRIIPVFRKSAPNRVRRNSPLHENTSVANLGSQNGISVSRRGP